MRRILLAPRAILCFNPCRHFVFPLFIVLLISACNLPPKPRLLTQQVQPQRPQKGKPVTPRETQHAFPKPTSFYPPISPNKKKITTYPMASDAVSKLTPEKNSDERLLSVLSVFLNARYELGGMTPDGVDCSGLVKAVFAETYGFNLPHNAAAQFRLGSKTLTENLRLGDLVFFETRTRRGRYISHVGIYLSNRRFAHASTKAGVIISGLDEAYWRRRYAGAQRLIDQP